MSEAPAILVVEDDTVLGPALLQRLRLEGFRVRLAPSGASGLADAKAVRPDAVVCDIRLPDMSGEEVYRGLLAGVGAVPTWFMTAFGDVAQAVRLVKGGARDYLTKPVDVDRLVAELAAVRTSGPGRAEAAAPAGDGLGASARIRAVENILRKAARVDVPVLLTGETGTGKEVAARFLHAVSARAEEPFVAINCAAIPRDLIEGTLFGHEKGAFTGALARSVGQAERAGRGTLFLDEIGELTPDLQAKLLRLVQERAFLPLGAARERPFEARIVCATHADLRTRLRDGSFREDLYYRINVVEVAMPALRERPEDVPWLAQRFLREAGERFGLIDRRLEPDALEALADHDWPGNARELRNRIERALALGDGPTLSVADLFPEVGLDLGLPGGEGGVLDAALDQTARATIAEILRRNGGNRADAARQLGISRTTLWKRMRDLGLS